MTLTKALLSFLLMALPLFSSIRPIFSAGVVTTELTLDAVEDAYVDSGDPDSNFGNSSYLYARFWDYTSIPDMRRNSYLKFDLSTVSTEVNIVYARLELYCWSAWSPTPDVGVHYCVVDSWNENETTWNNAPSFSSVPTCVISVLDDDRWYAWDIGKDVKTALEDGILTVVLSVQNVGASFESSFYSKEGWRNHPRLVIEYATQVLCSASPSVVTLGDSVMVLGYIPIPRYDTVQLTYTRPDMSTIVMAVATDSEGYFTDSYTPDVVGLWGATAAWEGAEGYNASSSTDIFVVTENESDNWAIIIGVADYEKVKDLDYTDDDAIELYNKLKEVWPEDHLKLLVNEEAAKSNIESAIKDWLAPNETAESVVLFFFSGHGRFGPDVVPYDETDGEDEYICPYDALTGSYNNDIRDDTLDSWLGSLDSQRISVFLDSCYSGGFIDKVTGEEFPLSDLGDGFAKDLSKGGRVIITASNETETSWEYGDLKHGVFAYYILEGLDNLELLDDNKDNGISAEEIFDYVEPLVRVYAEGEGNPQHPQMYDGCEGELMLITTVTINLDTNPFKTSIVIDEVSYTPPVSFVWPLYTEHTFQVSKLVWLEYGETRYVFNSWSDGNNLTFRTIIVWEFVLVNYTANYQTQHYLTVSSEHGDPQGEGWYDNGSMATFSVSSPVDLGNGTRFVFTEWFGDVSSTDSSSNVVVDAPKQVFAQWKTQHYLNVDIDPLGIVSLSGEGWYDEGSMAVTGSAQSIVSGGEGTQYLFDTWKVDDVAESGYSISVSMDSPHSAVACYRTQHYLAIVSQHGQPEGQGWYDKGSVATFSVESPQGLIIQKVFVEWSGDSTSTSPSATIVMDGPKTVTANWRDEYTQLYIVLAVAALVTLIIIFGVVKKLRAR
jgi:hypothetical protein